MSRLMGWKERRFRPVKGDLGCPLKKGSGGGGVEGTGRKVSCKGVDRKTEGGNRGHGYSLGVGELWGKTLGRRGEKRGEENFRRGEKKKCPRRTNH